MWLKSIFNKSATVDQDEERLRAAGTPAAPSSPPPVRAAAPARPELQPAASSANNQIQYDEKLISQLKGDHAALLLMYSSVANKMSSDSWESIPGALREMRMAMYGHLLTEGVKLYSYMRRNLAEEPNLLEVYRSYKREMDGIGRVAFDFSINIRARIGCCGRMRVPVSRASLKISARCWLTA
ncbi:hypothetical protein CAter10_4039 [Collimonas arenae]|uniref:hypothetical protein n=1 Tax=Collimonas arenae TaxID=279058 RepID=UPI0007787150|nr:hypothetical protein [Collimonas arenae]AMP01476.1 hypothetical protein CAter10_4039 [Collimonas arenae]